MRVSIPEHVVFRSFVEETVLLNLRSGRYHGLNATAGRIFEVLSETGDPGEASRRVAAEYGVGVDLVEADVVALCAELAERGLAEVHDVPA